MGIRSEIFDQWQRSNLAQCYSEYPCGMTYGELLLAQQDCKRDGLVFAEDTCMCSITPIIIDTRGTGFALTSAANGVDFRVGPGKPLRLVAWTTAQSGNAFLVLDRNGNGTIDDLSELFGNASGYVNGFLALASFDEPAADGNGDEVIDQHDSVFEKLRLWIDSNHNGISEGEELLRLPDLGVNSISLDYRASIKKDDAGNLFRYRAKLNQRTETPTGRWAFDVLLKSESIFTQPTDGQLSGMDFENRTLTGIALAQFSNERFPIFKKLFDFRTGRAGECFIRDFKYIQQARNRRSSEMDTRRPYWQAHGV